MLLGFGTMPVQKLVAEDHLVKTADLHRAIVTAAEARQDNQAKVQRFFSTEPAKKALRNAKVDLVQIEKAIPHLSDQELARLANQTEKIQKDFAAGALTNEQITYIIIALATAVIILVLVVA
jgi:hypothetical protein